MRRLEEYLMAKVENNAPAELEWSEQAPWIKIGCWTTIALLPFLYWENGPAVSTDQYVMRSILITVAIIGALGLCVWNRCVERRLEETRNADGLCRPGTTVADVTEGPKK